MAALQQVIKIDAVQFKSDASMSSEIEMLEHMNHIELVFRILLSHSTTVQ